MEEKGAVINEIGMEEIRQFTLERLKNVGITVNLSLPLLEDSVKVQAIDTIAKRIVILFAFKAMVIYEEDRESIKSFLLKSYKDYLSHSEYQVLKRLKLSKQDKVKFSWYSESLYALLWSVNIINSKRMEYPPQEIKIDKHYLDLLPPEEPFLEFKSRLDLREIKSLLLELDFYYHLNWIAKKENEKKILGFFKKNKSSTYNISVIMERRRALEWLIYGESNWNDIVLDT